MPSKKKQKREIKSYAHDKEERKNNPPVGLVNLTDAAAIEKKTYNHKPHDPYFEPQLQWAEKVERTSFEIPTVSLHVHERIDPRTIIEAVKKRNGNGDSKQINMFDNDANIPFSQAIEFYKHAQNWSNRLIAGDSCLVLNSLLQKENMAGKVQCVYMDPPYGIKYGSNFQPYTNKPKVKDKDLTTEPEMIKAFRDTWELGIHSYLSYMRDRLLLAKELLSDSGSCFVQIGSENVHRISLVMDKVFEAKNRIATISFATTSSRASTTLPKVADYLLWYAKDKKQIKYRQLYEQLNRAEIIDLFNWDVGVELPDGSCRKPTDEERFNPDKFLPEGARIYQRAGLASQGASNTERSKPYEWNNRTFNCPPNSQWRISKEGLDKLSKLGRLEALEGQSSLRWKKYEDEVPGKKINNLWSAQMYPSEKRYVVETATKAISRCILMSTDPGDIVLDPTCGSGTTAYVAEQWGRRWITCDTSRVAITLAKQRLMTAIFDYYKLAYPDEGISSGFDLPTYEKVTSGILAGTVPAQKIYLYDRPRKDTKKARVTGPFTVEAVPSPTVQPVGDIPEPPPSPADESVARSGATLRHDEWCDELLKTGIRGKAGQRISFSRINSLPGPWINAEAETKPDDSGDDKVADTATAYQPTRAVISFGPEHGLLESRQVEAALQDAILLKPTPQIVIFAAFRFDPEAAKTIDETDLSKMTLLKVEMNSDLQTEDLKREDRASDSFWLIGQPEVSVNQIQEGDAIGQWQVEVNGFDYFNTKTGQLESGDKSRIAVWMLDTDYDGRSLYPKQVFFPMASSKDGWAKLAKSLQAEIDETLIGAYKGTKSLPFELGENKRIAVKIVDDRGIESLKVIDVIPEKEK